MILSRRDVVRFALSGVAASTLPFPRWTWAATDAPELPIPALFEPGQDSRVLLDLRSGTHAFSRGVTASTWGISAPFLGPVVRLPTGRAARMEVRNNLGEPTSLHWHGLLVPSDMDGGPHNSIAAGGVWQPEFEITQRPATTWFHPHPHQDAARQTYRGLAGMMILTDGGDRARGLPATYGVDDLPLILQDRRFGANGEDAYAPSVTDLLHGFQGDTLLVNGVIAPVARVPIGIIRLRLLNAANARNFDLAFSDERAFAVIASDGGFLAKPVETRRLVMAPGERYEILVDFADGKAVELVTWPHESGMSDAGMGAMEGMDMAMPAGPSTLMQFAPDSAHAAEFQKLPDALEDPGAPDQGLSVRRRQFVFDEMTQANAPVVEKISSGASTSTMNGMAGMKGMGDMPGMDHGTQAAGPAVTGPALLPATSGLKMAMTGQTFALDRIDAEVAHGSHEIWEITSQEMAHPFHIHGAHFRVLAKDGAGPRPEEAGWKDVVLIEKHAELLIRFEQPASRERPFMFHCHILEHEDLGMMGQYVTV